jgi:hypothetical protein
MFTSLILIVGERFFYRNLCESFRVVTVGYMLDNVYETT